MDALLGVLGASMAFIGGASMYMCFRNDELDRQKDYLKQRVVDKLTTEMPSDSYVLKCATVARNKQFESYMCGTYDQKTDTFVALLNETPDEAINNYHANCYAEVITNEKTKMCMAGMGAALTFGGLFYVISLFKK